MILLTRMLEVHTDLTFERLNILFLHRTSIGMTVSDLGFRGSCFFNDISNSFSTIHSTAFGIVLKPVVASFSLTD